MLFLCSAIDDDGNTNNDDDDDNVDIIVIVLSCVMRIFLTRSTDIQILNSFNVRCISAKSLLSHQILFVQRLVYTFIKKKTLARIIRALFFYLPHVDGRCDVFFFLFEVRLIAWYREIEHV